MNETMGQRIASLRKQHGMSQENLAEKMGVSSQAVSKWENDASCPDISLLPKLAKLLDVTVDQLLTGESNQVKLLPAEQRKSLDQLTLRVRVLSSDGDRIRVNLPMSLVKIGLEMGMDLSSSMGGADALKQLDLSKIMELAERGAIGKIVEVESADGDHIEVVVE